MWLLPLLFVGWIAVDHRQNSPRRQFFTVSRQPSAKSEVTKEDVVEAQKKAAAAAEHARHLFEIYSSYGF